MKGSLTIRILIVNNYARMTGGADLQCLEITEGLRRRGHEVRWLATQSEANLENSGSFVPLAVAGDNREHLTWRRSLKAARWALWNPAAASAMESLILSFRPDVVHVHKAYVQLSVAPIVVAARHRLPIVQTAHDYEFISASPLDSTGGIWDRNEAKFSFRALNSATMVARRFVHRPRVWRWIAVSDDLASTYRSVGGIECSVIPNFTDKSPVAPVPFDKRKGVLFMGRLSPEKGVEHVLEAARLIPEIPFSVAGGGPLAERVEASAGELDNLEYLGFVENSEGRSLLRQSRLCVLPSLWQEPASLVGLEAMSEGTPIVSYRRGGLAEYVSDAGAGSFSPNQDPRGLADSIASIYSDRGAWTQLSDGGRDGVAARHSRSRYLDSLEALYSSVLDAGAPEAG